MPLVKEIIKFPIESLVFQNRLLNGAHSIRDIKLPWVVLKNNIDKSSCFPFNHKIFGMRNKNLLNLKHFYCKLNMYNIGAPGALKEILL